MSVAEAHNQLGLLTDVVQRMKEEQNANASFTEGQLAKASKQLDTLNSKPSALNKENVFNGVASIGTNLRFQADNLKSGDPVRITSGVLTLVSGVAMCFGPVGMAVGAVTGLVSGIMTLFAGTPKPTMTEVIGNMINEQTKQIANMLDKMSEHIDNKFKALSEQITDEFMKLATNLQNEFIKQKQFNEQLVAQSNSTGALQVLVNSLNYLSGFIEKFDANADKVTLNSEIDRLLAQITIRDGVSEIGQIKAMIQQKLQELDKILDLTKDDKAKNTEAYYLLHNYTIQMIASLINVYVTLNTYRYMILFQLANLLDSVGDKPNSSGMQKLLINIQFEGNDLLKFLAKPSANKKYEIIISGYIRASKTAQTIDEYLKFCTSKADGFGIDTSNTISLNDAIPAFNPNNLYAIRSKNDPNNILVTAGVVNEYLFISNAASFIGDATLNQYSLYYQLESDKKQPWKISLKGHGISYNKAASAIYATKRATQDYPLSLLVAIPTDSDEKSEEKKSMTFMLMTDDNPGNLLKLKDSDEKSDEKESNSMSLVQPFSRTTNFEENYAMYELTEPKAPIANAKDIVPQSTQELNQGATELIPVLEDPTKFSVIDPETAKKINATNSKLIAAIVKSFEDKGLTGTYFTNAFDENEKTKSGKQLAISVQDVAIQLMRTRSKMRISAQFVWEIMSYAPAIDDSTEDGKKQRVYWNTIKASSKTIIDSVIQTLIAGSAFWSFLTAFSQSFQKFITEQSDSDDAKENPDEVKEWLTNTVKLPQYLDNFMNNGATSLALIKMYITDKSALKDIGITMIFHQKAIMAAIAKLGDDGGSGSGDGSTAIAKQKLTMSLKWLKQDLDKFLIFAAEYTKKTKQLQKDAGDAISGLIDKAIGDKGIQEKQNNLIEKQNDYNNTLRYLQQQQNLKKNQLDPQYAQQYNLEAAIATDKQMMDYMDGNIKNLDWAITNALTTLNTIANKLPTATNTEQHEESTWWGFSHSSKTVTTNRRKHLLEDQTRFEKLKADEQKNKDAINDEKAKVKDRYEKNNALLNQCKRDILAAEAQWTAALKTPQGNVARAREEWENANNQIIEAIKQTGQSQSQLVDFLDLTNGLQPLTVQTIESTTKLADRVQGLVYEWERQCAVAITINDYCDGEMLFGSDKNSDMKAKVLKALADNGFVNMNSMNYNGDADAYKTDIEDGIFAKHKELTLTTPQKRAFKEAATNPDKTWVPNYQNPQERTVRTIFLDSFGILLKYVSYIKEVIDNADQQLKIERFDEGADENRVKAVDDVKQIEGAADETENKTEDK